MGYQERDHEIIDYEMFRVPGIGRELRGPAPRTLAAGEYFSCVGAAQTFGCFCEHPYPSLLAEISGLPVLNLGIAGAGPRFFLQNPAYLRYVNAGRFAIVQVMSGRSEDNSAFDTGGLEWLTRRSDGRKMGAEPAYRELLAAEGPDRVRAVVDETRRNWVESFSTLLDAIKVPKILFWFSKRAPHYEESYDDVLSIFGKYPHLVTRAMVERLKPLCDEYVECVTERGSPQPLYSRFTGEPVLVPHRPDIGLPPEQYNRYYPSPAMQADAAYALTDAHRRYAAPRERRPDPIIVYGAPRSGTTYLEQILNAHPDVYVSHETRVFAWLFRALRLTDNQEVVANERDRFVSHLRGALPGVIRDFYETLAPEVRCWGDKNPHYAALYNDGVLDVIDELFPHSMFIHIIRDGRDVVSSLVRKRSDEGKPWVTFENAHATWKRHVRIGRAFGDKVSPNRYFEVRYEDLVADDVAQARRLFDFLGLELHPDVEAFCRSQQTERTPFMGPTRDLGAGVTGSDWATIFTGEEQARSLEMIGPALVRNGYETEQSLARLREATSAALQSVGDDHPLPSAK